MRRLPFILLALVLAGSFAFHAGRAANPTSDYQSADERSYGKLALNIAEERHYGDASTRMRDPLHWPPGAPALFALAHAVAPDAGSERTKDIPAAYWSQALLAVGTNLAAFGLAWALAGPWLGLLAAALVGFYPPLILATGEQLSEPLGAFLLTGAFCVLALSHRARFKPGYAAAGVLLGATALTRADLLLVPFLLAIVWGGWVWWRRRERRRAITLASLVAGGAAAAIAPWCLYASTRADELVPVTRGSAAAFFVGTYLPGGGTTVGMKRALAPLVYARRPRSRKTPPFELDAGYVLQVAIASRHPELPDNDAIALEGRRNLVRYGLRDPLDFGVMMLDKVQRMWSRYARGGARHTEWTIRAWHVLVVLGAFAGLLAGLSRRREAALAAVGLAAAYSTALHALVVSQARYNLPLMPAVIAAGVAGWAIWWRSRRPEPKPGEAAPTVEQQLQTAAPAVTR